MAFAWSMRIYYPINDEEPTPALPKGGSLNEAQYSLTTNRLTSNGRFSPLPLGGPGVGSFFLHFVLKASKLERRPYLPQPSTLPSLGERLRVGELRSGMGLGVGVRRLALSPLPWGGAGVGVSYAPKGQRYASPGQRPGNWMQQGNAPEGGKRITAQHYRVAKGVSGIIILLPILGECWLRTIPKALPWADLFWSFRPSANFHSSEQDWWVSCPFVLLS